MAQTRCVKLRLDGTFEEKKFKVDRNQILDGRKKRVTFHPTMRFVERKKGIFRWFRKARNLIFFVDGSAMALDFTKDTEGFNPYWTMEEGYDFSHKMVAKLKASQYPITWTQFFVFLFPLILTLGLVALIAGRVGVF